MVRNKRKIKNLFSIFVVFAAISFVLISADLANAWNAKGFVYCDVNGDKQIDTLDLPLSYIVVNVNSLTSSFTGWDVTDAAGYFRIDLPDVPESFVETLDITTLPSDATFIIPPVNGHSFVTTDAVRSDFFEWLIDSSICHPVVGGECRMTGGGVDVNGEILLGTFASASDQKDRYTFGGQIGAPTASQPQPYGEWTHHQQKGPSGDFIFHAGTSSAPKDTMITLVTCSDPGYCNPARPAPFKQIDYEGIGSFRNVKGSLNSFVVADNKPNYTKHYFRAHVEDIGEPGAGGKQIKDTQCTHVPGTPIDLSQCEHCPDVYQIEIHATEDPASPVIYSVGGFIDGGNLQIHPPIQ